MPIRKKQKRDVVRVEDTTHHHTASLEGGATGVAEADKQVMVRLLDDKGESVGGQILLPVTATPAQLNELLIHLFDDQDERRRTPYAFFIHDNPVTSSVRDNLFRRQADEYVEAMLKQGRRVRPQDVAALDFVAPEETVIEITYKPQAVFRVRPVTRCAGTLDDHTEAILIVSFSPDSEVLATGGGDRLVRVWDVHTLTPTQELKGHSDWVQVLSWSPDGGYLVSGSKDGALMCWRPSDHYSRFAAPRRMQQAHSRYVSHVSWEPLHKQAAPYTTPLRFVSASKDTSLRVWSVQSSHPLFSLSGHQSCVTCVKWGGEDRIYSSSQDRTVMVWSAVNGSACCVLRGHAHWVNFIALSTDGVIRTGAFDHEERVMESREAMCEHARRRYAATLARSDGVERVVSCSDDNTMFLWAPQRSTMPLARMTGHQGVVFHIQFSPDGTMLASCSADKSVKLWNAATGRIITTFRGHVAAVYHVSWSLDSRLLVSGSKDTTLKLWSVEKRALVEDMSGHSDEIFSTDWSPDGQRVATGSKDKRVRIWVH